MAESSSVGAPNKGTSATAAVNLGLRCVGWVSSAGVKIWKFDLDLVSRWHSPGLAIHFDLEGGRRTDAGRNVMESTKLFLMGR